MAGILVSPGTSVTITNESYYIPATAPTVPLFFIATRADKKQADGVSVATGSLEHSVVRTITSLNQSVSTYGVPHFKTEVDPYPLPGSGAALHGDARNEYGLMALNQALTILSRAYVVRANVDLADADIITYSAGAPLPGSNTGTGSVTTPVVNQTLAVDETWTLTGDAISGPIAMLGSLMSGSLYVDGTYLGVPLTGGTGTGATADITVALGLVTTVTLVSLGTVYAVNDSLTTPNTNLGGAGSGFSVLVTAIPATMFNVSGFISGAQTDSPIGVPYNNGIVSFTITQSATPFITGDAFTFNVTHITTMNPLGANDAAKRASIVTALRAEINSNTDVRSEIYEYNLILCPGYYEVAGELLNLNLDINEEAFIISDCPFNQSPEDTATWSGTGARENSQNIGYYYPNALASNLDGVEVFCAASGVALKTIAYSDSVSEVWYPPAGERRGLVSGVSDVGYLTGMLGNATKFVSTPLNQGQRDILYETAAATGRINIIPVFPGKGILVFGQKTSAPSASALDRINVMRLMVMIKRDIRKASFAYLFELNDRITRDSIKQTIENYLNDILLRRGLYDFAVVCDLSNNTSTTIDRNELHVSVALKPTKGIEFIYIPLRIVSSGASL